MNLRTLLALLMCLPLLLVAAAAESDGPRYVFTDGPVRMSVLTGAGASVACTMRTAAAASALPCRVRVK